ncbi:MAG: hypothetical protein AAB780_00575 [Patescibacteria group bacterium]
MKNKILLPILFSVFPMIASAQFGGMKGLIGGAGDIVLTLTKIAVALALLAFFWGLVRFIFAVGGDTAAVEQGRTLMIWGLVALFVMVAVWGIIYFIGDELFPGGAFAPAPAIPTFPRP